MSSITGIWYATSSTYVALATGITVVSGTVTNSGINTNWGNYVGASGTPDNLFASLRLSPSGRSPGLKFSLPLDAVTALAGQEIFSLTTTLRITASGIGSSGSVVSGYFSTATAILSDLQAFTVSTTGTRDYVAGGSGRTWGLGTFPSDLADLALITRWTHVAAATGSILVDSVKFDFTYGTPRVTSVFNNDRSYPSYRL